MNILINQEREHWDFEAGRATEAQNAFTEAISLVGDKQAEQAARISRARSLGLFVVVKEIEQFCTSTDAFVGVFHVFVVAVPSEVTALKKASRLSSVSDSVVVLPPYPVR